MSKRTTILCPLLVVGLLTTSVAFCDGGTLHFKSSVQGVEDVLWGLGDVHLSSRRLAQVVLDRGKAEGVTVLESDSPFPMRFLVSLDEPPNAEGSEMSLYT